jgi:hypothetical protein
VQGAAHQQHQRVVAVAQQRERDERLAGLLALLYPEEQAEQRQPGDEQGRDGHEPGHLAPRVPLSLDQRERNQGQREGGDEDAG